MNWMWGYERKLGVKDDFSWKDSVVVEMRRIMWKVVFFFILFSCVGRE